ncbi:Co-chaperone protein DjlA [Dickeya dianthicola]|uniref:Co-chaperone protein DjlA n=1 Tax=Dickeya dianthicola TaxID=204039 RepID=A0AAP6VEK4_9GAMM|nr:co-chaperone DjlA [Dickeya dianthicola]ATO34760.1 DnaJ-like protein DjlA [Dickeya dianthicola RNS04.9]AYC20607.1 Co-chaperone protein DjlA [Dickeya dianthicola]MBI0436689.1 co-chaperone DjlA [Dickeya dianthicola]MBI0451059.1 co-chaperone DjlA [Dickeya dianthicola]MBI0451901.1 co-chaperone DjlA [Dickeya dianthicola]
MRYWGKLLGLALGIASSAGVGGLIIGLLLGHLLDRARASRQRDFFSAQATRQALFCLTTFQAMGHLAKSKGRVTESDIRIATTMMDRLELHGEARNAAQRAFREGKASLFPVRSKLRKLRDACIGRFDLIRMFLEIQLQVAFVDGALHPSERRLLYVFADELGVTREQFELFMRNMERGNQQSSRQSSGYQSRQNSNYQSRQNSNHQSRQNSNHQSRQNNNHQSRQNNNYQSRQNNNHQSRQNSHQSSRQGNKSYQRRNQSYGGQSYGQRPPVSSYGPTVESACRTLGVRSSDDAVTVKRAYRKLMSEHHPDKMMGKGLSPRMIEMAKRKAQDIQAAYEFLKINKFSH